MNARARADLPPAPTRRMPALALMHHVLCFGNLLHGDDGLGPALAERLLATGLPPGTRVYDVGTRGLDALPLFEGCDRLTLVDAEAPAPGAVPRPGRIRQVPPEALLAGPVAGPHGAGLALLLRAAATLGPLPPLRLFTVEAGVVAPFRPGLSPAVAASLGPLAARVLADPADPVDPAGPAHHHDHARHRAAPPETAGADD